MEINKSVELFIVYCRSIKLSENTIENYEQHLKRFTKFLNNSISLETVNVNDITVQMIRMYFIELQQEYAIATVKQHRAVLSTFYRWLTEDMEIIEINPLASVKPRFKHESKKQSVVRSDEVSKILTMFDNVPKTRRHFRYWRNRFMIELMYSCGVRVSEVLNLRHSMYDEEEHSFSFIAKRDKEHKVFITNEDTVYAYLKLREMRDVKFPDCDYVFTTKQGELLTRSSVRWIINTITNDAGIEKHITPHSFRRGCATALLENGADISAVKGILGHSDISTTMRYVQLSEKAVKNTMKNCCPLNNIR